jgi:hypothetical protein
MDSALGIDGAHIGNGQYDTCHGMARQRYRCTVECFGGDFAGIGRKPGLNQCVDLL